MGEIHMHFAAGPTGNMIFQVSNDEGSADDEGVTRINENDIVTKWVTHTTTAIGATDATYRIALSDIGARWVDYSLIVVLELELFLVVE